MRWNAVILAGDRVRHDPVANLADVSCKAVAPIGASSLLSRVVSALAVAQSIDQIYCVGPDESRLTDNKSVEALFAKFAVTRLPVEAGPSLSALRGVQASSQFPTLIVTCDLPLIESSHIDTYCQRLNNFSADFVIGAVESHKITQLVPGLQKTTYQFGNQSICFANVFSVLTENGLQAIEFWRSVEGSRKKPLEVIRQVGGLSILQYKLGILSLDQAARQLSRKTSAQMKIVDVPSPELAVDVDSADDYKLLQAKLAASQ